MPDLTLLERLVEMEQRGDYGRWYDHNRDGDEAAEYIQKLEAERDKAWKVAHDAVARGMSAERQVARLLDMSTGLAVQLNNLLEAYKRQDVEMCCNGRECGCRGATIHEEAEHYAREQLSAYYKMEIGI